MAYDGKDAGLHIVFLQFARKTADGVNGFAVSGPGARTSQLARQFPYLLAIGRNQAGREDGRIDHAEDPFSRWGPVGAAVIVRQIDRRAVSSQANLADDTGAVLF